MRAVRYGTFGAVAAVAIAQASCAALSGLEDLAPASADGAVAGDDARPGGDDATAGGDAPTPDAAVPGEASIDGGTPPAGCGSGCPSGSTCNGTVCNVTVKSSCTSAILVPSSGATFQVQICSTDTNRPSLQCEADAAAAPTPSAIFEVPSTPASGGAWRVNLLNATPLSGVTVEMTTVDAQCTQKAGACSTVTGGSTSTSVPANSYVAVGIAVRDGGSAVCDTVQVTFKTG